VLPPEEGWPAHLADRGQRSEPVVRFDLAEQQSAGLSLIHGGSMRPAQAGWPKEPNSPEPEAAATWMSWGQCHGRTGFHMKKEGAEGRAYRAYGGEKFSNKGTTIMTEEPDSLPSQRLRPWVLCGRWAAAGTARPGNQWTFSITLTSGCRTSTAR